MSGYLHSNYSRSLAEFGVPRLLPGSKGWLLERQIPGALHRDAMGPYPLFACADWSGLPDDLESLKAQIVTLALVPDPFGNYERALLERCFDRVDHFKVRYVIDVRQGAGNIGTSHHRYYAKRALSTVSVEPCPFPTQFAEEWVGLYAGLVRRHSLMGIKAFSPEALSEQLRVPGLVMFRALNQGHPVGIHLWYVQGPVAYSHLTAITDAGYRLGASYALYSFAINWFSPKVLWLDLGAGSGTSQNPADGLSQFKRGWSTGTRPTYFCTRVYDREKYATILETKGNPVTTHFPAYRAGEFA